MVATNDRCPWRFRLNDSLFACEISTYIPHKTHRAGDVTWRDSEGYRFVPGGPVDPPGLVIVPPDDRFRMTPIDTCANQYCPNRAHEGRMVLLTVHTDRRAGVIRDVSLILCAPCAEYLARRVR